MTAKLIAGGVLALVLAGAGIWLVNTIQENERLTLNNATLEQARKDDAEIMQFLRADNEAKQAAAQRRSQQVAMLNEALRKARKDVRVITKTVVTEAERECLYQPVPAAIVSFMLSDKPAGPHAGD